MKKSKKISIVLIIILVLIVGRACGGKNNSETRVEEQAKPETETNMTVEDSETAESESEETVNNDASDSDAGAEELSPEFKKTMDDYEAWFDHYCEVMKKYQDNPSDMELLSEMSELLSEETKMLEQMEKMDQSEMNAAELAYYTEVNARILQKLSEVS